MCVDQMQDSNRDLFACRRCLEESEPFAVGKAGGSLHLRYLPDHVGPNHDDLRQCRRVPLLHNAKARGIISLAGQSTTGRAIDMRCSH